MRRAYVTCSVTRLIRVTVDYTELEVKEGGMQHMVEKMNAALEADINRPVKPWDYEVGTMEISWRDE